MLVGINDLRSERRPPSPIFDLQEGTYCSHLIGSATEAQKSDLCNVTPLLNKEAEAGLHLPKKVAMEDWRKQLASEKGSLRK